MMNHLECLIYISRSRLDRSALPPAIEDIVAVSSFRNREAGITGILTCHDDCFIQMLEGAPAALDLLMIHLHFDERHNDIRVVARQPIMGKAALTWAMAAPADNHPLRAELGKMIERPPGTVAPWRNILLEMVTEPA